MTKRVVLISGAGRGIGRATAEGSAAAATMLLAAPTDELTAVAVHAAGGTATVVLCDVTAEPHVARLVETAASIGPLDVVVCNAGHAVVAPFESLSLADWERTLRTTLTGTFLLAKHAVENMPRGGVLFSQLVTGRSGIPTWSAYSAAKFGVLGFAQAIQSCPARHQSDVGDPGAVDTPLWDTIPGIWNRANMLRPEDVARSIVQAADEPLHVSIDEIMLGHMVGRL